MFIVGQSVNDKESLLVLYKIKLPSEFIFLKITFTSRDKCLNFFSKNLRNKRIFTCNRVLLKYDLLAHVLSVCLYIEEEKK